METLKLIADKIINSNGEEIVYGRRIIRYDPEENKTDHEKYLEGNINQFYGWISPEIGPGEENK